MKYIFVGVLVSFCFGSISAPTGANQPKAPSSLVQNRSSSPNDSFYTTTSQLVQEQINLIARIEYALAQPDPNRVRAVNGQILVQAKAIEGLIKRQDPSYKTSCTSQSNTQLRDSQAQIYCGLYGSSQELLKLAPTLDRILSRRGELALVRELPIISGEIFSDPVLATSKIERPNLGHKATPFAIQEPNILSTSAIVIGQPRKTANSNYRAPIQSAIVTPQEALSILEVAQKHIAQAQASFPQSRKFENPRETRAALDRFAYDLDQQEAQTYAKFLASPKTGIFRVLPYSAYHRPLNTLQNRLLKSVDERYPFPSLAENKQGFIPNLALQIVGDSFHMQPKGIDYSFMVNLGNLPLDKLDANLKNIHPTLRKAFLNYQPPKQLKALQQERRRFITGKNQNTNPILLANAPAKLDRTYIMRTFQFQLSDVIINGQQLTPQQRLQIDELLKIQSSDTIVAFRPVRQRSDGSYTVLWKVIKQLDAPQIEDLEAYLKY